MKHQFLEMAHKTQKNNKKYNLPGYHYTQSGDTLKINRLFDTRRKSAKPLFECPTFGYNIHIPKIFIAVQNCRQYS